MRPRLPVLATLLLAAVRLTAAVPEASAPSAPPNPQVQRGDYLVRIMACHDCHTPFHVGPNGPEPDMSRQLSGHPQDVVVTTPPDLGKGPWAAASSATNTAWAGPWGISFTANLTPDPETGLGRWDEETFIRALRTGRHEGRGRPILPPMPWPLYRQATDEDLRAVFAYLRTIPPIRNKVPQPIEPAEPAQGQ